MAASVPELLAALEAGELTVLFQPIVDLGTYAVVGAEALWQWPGADPGWEALLDEPAAEPAGRQLVRDALASVAGWHARSPRIGLTLNATARQLSAPWWCDELTAWLELGNDARAVTVQVSTAEAHARGMGRTMAHLRDAGFRVALDRLGADADDLALVHRLPVDAVRLDPSLVSRLDEPSVLASVALLLHERARLGVEITAAGIEDETQRHRLRSLGCRHGQGPLTGRPVSAVALTHAIRHH